LLEAGMKLSHLIVTLTGAAALGLPLLASAQHNGDLGKREYEANCASCHGMTGKGDGPLSSMMASAGIAASDLTVLAKKNNGVYPFARVYELIDGTQQVKAHGTGAMPIWGADYVVKGSEYYVDVPFNAAIYVRSRILALTEYVYRLQAK
jgi:mono/diheme cytochrome c family protein